MSAAPLCTRRPIHYQQPRRTSSARCHPAQVAGANVLFRTLCRAHVVCVARCGSVLVRASHGAWSSRYSIAPKSPDVWWWSQNRTARRESMTRVNTVGESERPRIGRRTARMLRTMPVEAVTNQRSRRSPSANRIGVGPSRGASVYLICPNELGHRRIAMRTSSRRRQIRPSRYAVLPRWGVVVCR